MSAIPRAGITQSCELEAVLLLVIGEVGIVVAY